VLRRHAAAVGQRHHVNWRLASDTCAQFVRSTASKKKKKNIGVLRHVSMDSGLPISDAVSLGERFQTFRKNVCCIL
jgi:hypothetical protein